MTIAHQLVPICLLSSRAVLAKVFVRFREVNPRSVRSSNLTAREVIRSTRRRFDQYSLSDRLIACLPPSCASYFIYTCDLFYDVHFVRLIAFCKAIRSLLVYMRKNKMSSQSLGNQFRLVFLFIYRFDDEKMPTLHKKN